MFFFSLLSYVTDFNVKRNLQALHNKPGIFTPAGAVQDDGWTHPSFLLLSLKISPYMRWSWKYLERNENNYQEDFVRLPWLLGLFSACIYKETERNLIDE